MAESGADTIRIKRVLTFLDENDEFNVEGFKAAVAVVFTGQEIIVGNADYPTERIGETTRAFRQLGIGYANLGALLMAQGLPYDSDAGRAWAAAITALLTGHAYATSARTAARMGPFAGFHENIEPMLNVLRMHQARHRGLSQELIDLKRLYWNCRTFAEGKRKGQAPYQHLGLQLPSYDFWELLQLNPEELKQKVSTAGVTE